MDLSPVKRIIHDGAGGGGVGAETTRFTKFAGHLYLNVNEYKNTESCFKATHSTTICIYIAQTIKFFTCIWYSW